MRSQTAALLYITAPRSPGALEPKFRGLSDCSLAMEHNTQRVVCSAFPLQTSFKLHVTLPHFSNSTWHFLCLGLISWCEAFTKPVPQLVNIKWLCQCLFFYLFFSSQCQILGWCLQFTTAMYLASCCCYLGKLQTTQKSLCFHGTVNSHLGMSPFFSFVSQGLPGPWLQRAQANVVWCKTWELGSIMCQCLTQVWHK